MRRAAAAALVGGGQAPFGWYGFRRRRPRPPRRGAQVVAQEPSPRARHHPLIASRSTLPRSFKVGAFDDDAGLSSFSGLRGQAGGAAGWLRQPHALELRRPRQARRKQNSPQHVLTFSICSAALCMVAKVFKSAVFLRDDP